MAKNWQYGRWRVAALQVVLWLTFGASLGLAGYIDHRRTKDLDVQLGEAIHTGRLIVRLPAGWEVMSGPAIGATTAIDLDRKNGERRRITITQAQQAGRVRGAEYYLLELMNARRIGGITSQPFRLLGQDDGVVISLQVDYRRLPTWGQEATPPGAPDPGVYACVVLPDHFTVTLQLVGDGAFGPSSWKLLRTLADNIRLADTPS